MDTDPLSLCSSSVNRQDLIVSLTILISLRAYRAVFGPKIARQFRGFATERDRGEEGKEKIKGNLRQKGLRRKREDCGMVQKRGQGRAITSS